MGQTAPLAHTSGMQAAVTTRSVFIVEDSALVRARLVEWVGAMAGTDVIGEAGTPADAITGILRTRPDFVVLDFQLDSGTGADVLRAIRSELPATVFIVLTNHALPQFRRACMEAGADAFLDKSSEIARVREIIEGAASA